MKNIFKRKKKMETLKTFACLPKGTKIKVITNTNSHNYCIGTVYTLKHDGYGNEMGNPFDEKCDGNNIKACDCVVAATTVELMEKELLKHEEECACLRSKIQACKELGLTEYDDVLCKVHTVLNVIKNGDGDDKEKARLIASIIKSC